MKLPPVISHINAELRGFPTLVLNIILIALGLFAIGVAAVGSPALKAGVAAWFIVP